MMGKVKLDCIGRGKTDLLLCPMITRKALGEGRKLCFLLPFQVNSFLISDFWDLSVKALSLCSVLLAHIILIQSQDSSAGLTIWKPVLMFRSVSLQCLLDSWKHPEKLFCLIKRVPYVSKATYSIEFPSL